MNKLRVLSLFAGIGGFDLGLERTGGFETVAFCEREDFPRRVLRKHWPHVPCFPDVRTLKGSDIDGSVDVICGGYPCQPFSTAGKRQGADDDRHLWPEFARLVDELRPAWVIGENVAGHISMGLDDVLADLEAKGYACQSFVIPACAVGASHRRDRVWIVANAVSIGQQGQGQPLQRGGQAPQRKRQANHAEPVSERGIGRAQSRMGGMVDGFSFRLDEPRERVKAGVKDRAARLKALGNAVHPDIPMMIGFAILKAEGRNVLAASY
jgi:DNA (cytosine-5)-methyltransferase 1